MEPVSFGQLPVEVLNHIIDKLERPELVSLSRASKWTRALTTRALWEATRIPVINDDEGRPLGLRPRDICLPNPIAPTKLRIYDYLADLYDPSCIHSRDSLLPWRSRLQSESRDPLIPLVNDTISALKQVEINSLHSFSWHTGTCLPASIFGEQGILSLQQPSLRSLSIISSSTCQRLSRITLSNFKSLRSLSWSDASPYNHEALATAIQINAWHLETLEVDFINWSRLWYIVEESDDPFLRYDEVNNEDELWICEDTYFEDELLGQMRNPLQPMFPVLRRLALTQVHLSDRTILTLNIGALESLTIRWCGGWMAFLRSIVELGVPLDLDHFELHAANRGWDGGDHALVGRFIESLSGPWSIFLGQMGTHSSHGVWNRLVPHQKSIKRFVHQLNTKALFGSDCPIQSDHLTDEDWDGMRRDPFRQNPFANFESLEFLGMTCEPAKMKILTMPFVTKSCLRVIHIRRALDCTLIWRDWILTEGVGDCLDPCDDSKEAEIDESKQAEINETYGQGEMTIDALRGEFRDFAEWVFGPDGIHSLKTLAFGDFSHISHTRRFSRGQVVLVRDESDSRHGNFKMVDRDEAVFRFNLAECLDAIEACPKCTLTKTD
ncbi:unnamed protein product [Clonostachys byssicola]|uniref:F-box domain-containing protein n=1 Tax=Clonostachys byssicola TaxID=160290 RepID=A0A9N9XY98_9HYPO|nr:unnamed protein product [Clonostachys byssicola]